VLEARVDSFRNIHNVCSAYLHKQAKLETAAPACQMKLCAFFHFSSVAAWPSQHLDNYDTKGNEAWGWRNGEMLVKCWVISSGDLMNSMATIINNTVLYTWNLLRSYIFSWPTSGFKKHNGKTSNFLKTIFYLFLPVLESSLLRGLFSSCKERGLLSSCGAVFSSCKAQAQ